MGPALRPGHKARYSAWEELVKQYHSGMGSQAKEFEGFNLPAGSWSWSCRSQDRSRLNASSRMSSDIVEMQTDNQMMRRAQLKSLSHQPCSHCMIKSVLAFKCFSSHFSQHVCLHVFVCVLMRLHGCFQPNQSWIAQPHAR